MNTTLVFDYDGTIHNTMIIYEPAIRETYDWLLANGFEAEEEPEAARIASWLGMNAKEMWMDFMPHLDEDIRETASKRVGSSMKAQIEAHKTKWYEGAVETLNFLKEKGYRMVILSNSKKQDGIIHFKEFGMDRWFDKWYDCESFDWAPKTDIIKTVAMDNPGNLVVIGDRRSDLEAAVAVKATFIGCQYGYGSADELLGADYLIDDISKLNNILRRL